MSIEIQPFTEALLFTNIDMAQASTEDDPALLHRDVALKILKNIHRESAIRSFAIAPRLFRSLSNIASLIAMAFPATTAIAFLHGAVLTGTVAGMIFGSITVLATLALCSIAMLCLNKSDVWARLAASAEALQEQKNRAAHYIQQIEDHPASQIRMV